MLKILVLQEWVLFFVMVDLRAQLIVITSAAKQSPYCYY